jgi:SAM-dependent methyltransferase
MMEKNEIRELFERFVMEQPLSAVLSGQQEKNDFLKVKVRPILSGGNVLIQAEEFRGKQAFHKNLELNEASSYLTDLMEHSFKQAQVETEGWTGQMLVSKKGKASVKVKKKTETVQNSALEAAWKKGISHNRKKRYIIEEGTAVPFLVDLGVQTKEGKIVNSRYDKFRQINRFLEFVEDILPQLNKEKEISILDFGCGKSYLTFAMYYYLHELKGYDVRIIGLDLKTDVIKHCNELSEKYGYKKLRFLEGNIADYTGADEVDMVVTLHACDTATDFALDKAVGWNAKVILSVPCCQHELNGQIQNDLLAPIFKYGLIKERMAALITDAMRAEYLEGCGYDVQILEFIDMEHTPKNILIRAVKSGKKKDNSKATKVCEDFFSITPTLGRLLEERGK